MNLKTSVTNRIFPHRLEKITTYEKLLTICRRPSKYEAPGTPGSLLPLFLQVCKCFWNTEVLSFQPLSQNT